MMMNTGAGLVRREPALQPLYKTCPSMAVIPHQPTQYSNPPTCNSCGKVLTEADLAPNQPRRSVDLSMVTRINARATTQTVQEDTKMPKRASAPAPTPATPGAATVGYKYREDGKDLVWVHAVVGDKTACGKAPKGDKWITVQGDEPVQCVQCQRKLNQPAPAAAAPAPKESPAPEPVQDTPPSALTPEATSPTASQEPPSITSGDAPTLVTDSAALFFTEAQARLAAIAPDAPSGLLLPLGNDQVLLTLAKKAGLAKDRPSLVALLLRLQRERASQQPEVVQEPPCTVDAVDGAARVPGEPLSKTDQARRGKGRKKVVAA